MSPAKKTALTRGFVGATLANFVALAGHISGGGSLPSVTGIGVPLVLSIAVCVLLAGKRLSAVRVGISVIVSQFLFHVLFSVGTPSGSISGESHHGHIGALQFVPADGVFDAVPAGGAMWLGHFLAAAITTFVLVHGESILVRLAVLGSRVRHWARGLLPSTAQVRVTNDRHTTPIEQRTIRPLESPHLSAIQGRAPPAVVTV